MYLNIKHIISKSDQLQSKDYLSDSFLEAHLFGQHQDEQGQSSHSIDKLL